LREGIVLFPAGMVSIPTGMAVMPAGNGPMLDAQDSQKVESSLFAPEK